MKNLGNILWLIFGGFFWFLICMILGAVLCVTLIGIPVGLQLFKLGRFVLWPFGKEVVDDKPATYKKVLNVIWAIILGWILLVLYVLNGVLLCITIIGIPFGLQYFKIAQFILLPLGHDFKAA